MCGCAGVTHRVVITDIMSVNEQANTPTTGGGILFIIAWAVWSLNLAVLEHIHVQFYTVRRTYIHTQIIHRHKTDTRLGAMKLVIVTSPFETQKNVKFVESHHALATTL